MAGQKLRCERERLTALMMAVMAEDDRLKEAKKILDQEDTLRESAQTALYGRVTANRLAEADLAARMQSRVGSFGTHLLTAAVQPAPRQSPGSASAAYTKWASQGVKPKSTFSLFPHSWPPKTHQQYVLTV